MILKHLEFLRFDTLKDLYDKLIEIALLNDKIKHDDDRIEITFHKDFVLSIKLKSYFSIFINGIICSNHIEDADIWEIIHNYLNENTIYVEFNGLLGKSKIAMLMLDKFERQKEKLMVKPKVKIYTIKELIFQN